MNLFKIVRIKMIQKYFFYEECYFDFIYLWKQNFLNKNKRGLLPSWNASRKNSSAKKPKPVAVAVTPQSQKQQSKDGNSKPKQPTKTGKSLDKEKEESSEGEFEFTDDVACIEMINSSYKARVNKDRTWELPEVPDNKGKTKLRKICDLDEETLNKLYAMPHNNLTRTKNN